MGVANWLTHHSVSEIRHTEGALCPIQWRRPQATLPPSRPSKVELHDYLRTCNDIRAARYGVETKNSKSSVDASVRPARAQALPSSSREVQALARLGSSKSAQFWAPGCHTESAMVRRNQAPSPTHSAPSTRHSSRAILRLLIGAR